MVPEHEVISQAPEVETSGSLLSVCREEHSAASVAYSRHKTERQGERSRDAFYHRICRTEHRLFHRSGIDDLGCGHLEVEMRFFSVAGSVYTSGDVDGVVSHLLDILTFNIAFSLLGHHILDLGLLCVEVIIHALHRVGILSLLEFRISLDHAGRVRQTFGEHGPCLDIIGYVICLDRYIIICDGNVSIVVEHTFAVSQDFHAGVPSC